MPPFAKRFIISGNKLGSPRILFFALIWLMVILIAGTIAQKYIGLYQAQNLFFASFIIWLGIIPLPGGMLTMAVVTLNLTCKLIFCSPWKLKRMGTIISHTGTLLLMVGGLLTAMLSGEGSMMLFEGETKDTIYDYHERELILYNSQNGVEKIITRLPWSDIKEGLSIPLPELTANLEVISKHRNCVVKDNKIIPLRSQMEDEANQTCIELQLNATDSAKNPTYIITESVPGSQALKIAADQYSVMLRKREAPLPFSVTLEKFTRVIHPGTSIPKSYSSEVVIKEGGLEWRSLIEMNKPLRYKGYALYQSSYVDADGKPASVLAVVKNIGRSFPYISSVLICIGLLIHFFQKMPRLLR